MPPVNKTFRFNSDSEDKTPQQPKDSIIKYRCDACRANFATEADLQFHMNSEYHRHHGSKK